MPLSISIPPSSNGEPVSFELRTIILSAIVTVSEFTVVVVPDTVRFPSILTIPFLDLIIPSLVSLSMSIFSSTVILDWNSIIFAFKY